MNFCSKHQLKDNHCPTCNATGTTTLRDVRIKMMMDHLSKIERDCSKPNWDGYSADPLSKTSLSVAKETIPRLDPLPSDVSLLWAGEIEAVWHCPDTGHQRVCVVFLSDGEIECEVRENWKQSPDGKLGKLGKILEGMW